MSRFRSRAMRDVMVSAKVRRWNVIFGFPEIGCRREMVQANGTHYTTALRSPTVTSTSSESELPNVAKKWLIQE